jgi:hypothetical protein
MKSVICVVGGIATALLVAFASAGQDNGLKVPMNHTHNNDVVVVGVGTLELKDHRLVWTEASKTQSSPEYKALVIKDKPKHSFSVPCSEVRGAELYIPKARPFQQLSGYENLIKVQLPDANYEFQSVSGFSATVILDQIRMYCSLGDPVLQSSKTRFTHVSDSLSVGPQTPSQGAPSFDAFYDNAGERGVIFVTRSGITFEPVAVGNSATSPTSLPCRNLTDLSVRGSGTGSFFVKASNPELDVHDGSITRRFLLGANIYAQAVKQAIADYCSQN